MKHICKVTVLELEVFTDLQREYLADPESGPCPCFQEGQVFEFHREPERDDFYRLGRGTHRGRRHPGRRGLARDVLGARLHIGGRASDGAAVPRDAATWQAPRHGRPALARAPRACRAQPRVHGVFARHERVGDRLHGLRVGGVLHLHRLFRLPGRYAVAALPPASASKVGSAPDAVLFTSSDDAIMLPYADDSAFYLLICGIRGSWRECAVFKRFEATISPLGVHCGMSRPFESLLDLRDHCWQAAAALEIGERREHGAAVHHFGRFALDAVVREAASHVPAAAFVHPALAVIEEYDREHDSELRDTVAAYLRSGGDAARAADALNIHKNTLRYRLAHIAELSGFDADDPAGRVHMYFGLRGRLPLRRHRH